MYIVAAWLNFLQFQFFSPCEGEKRERKRPPLECAFSRLQLNFLKIYNGGGGGEEGQTSRSEQSIQAFFSWQARGMKVEKQEEKIWFPRIEKSRDFFFFCNVLFIGISSNIESGFVKLTL